MTDRDHFAAAALTGLLYPEVDDEFAMSYIVGRAYLWADSILRERGRTNHDAAPAAIVPEPEPEPAARRRPAGGTGDTQEIAAYRQFVGEVMNWISEATGFLHDDVLRTDDARDIITDACSRCWDAFDRIALTDHGAAPAARASVGRPRTDNADLPTCAGTGDTQEPIKGDVSDRPTPITGPDPDSRVWETHTPATHATRGEGSEQRECTEPVAWAVCTPGDGDWSPCFFHEPHAQRCASAIFGSKNIVPLYRKRTLTDAEAETLRELRDEAAQYADEIGLCASEVRGRQRIINGLLVRLGGEG